MPFRTGYCTPRPPKGLQAPSRPEDCLTDRDRCAWCGRQATVIAHSPGGGLRFCYRHGEYLLPLLRSDLRVVDARIVPATSTRPAGIRPGWSRRLAGLGARLAVAR